MGKEQSAASTRRDIIAADCNMAWLTKDPPVEVGEIEVEDANLPWNARELGIIKKMTRFLENRERLQVGNEELEYYLLDPGKDISVISLTENAWDSGGQQVRAARTCRGKEVAGAARFFEARKFKPGRKEMEEVVCRRQERRHHADGKGKKWTLGNHGKEQKLRIGAPKKR